MPLQVFDFSTSKWGHGSGSFVSFIPAIFQLPMFVQGQAWDRRTDVQRLSMHYAVEAGNNEENKHENVR